MPGPEFASVDELTITREGDDRFPAREELKKEVLTTGAWSTVVYMYKEMKRTKAGESWSDPKLALVRYRKLKGALRPQKEFAISNLEHAKKLREVLGQWLEGEGEEEGEE